MRKHPKYCYGVTGTNGKTSVIHFLSQFKKFSIMNSMGFYPTKPIGLPGVFFYYPRCFNGIETLLEDTNKAGIKHLALEVFSVYLYEKKFDFIKFSGAAFTNLSIDHLISHGTMENYFLTKVRLFTELTPKDGFKIINGNCPYGKRLLKILNYKNCLAFGSDKSFPYYHDDKYIYFNGTKFPKSKISFFADHQMMNLLCAIGIAHISGIKNDEIIESLPNLRLVEGRLEEVTKYNKAKIFVDYAHNPDGLKEVLTTCRKITKNKIILIISIPSYDTSQRGFLVGQVSQKYADIVIVSEHYNQDSSDTTRKLILKGCVNAYEEPDRKKAIEMGINMLKEGDLLLICGLGKEKRIIQNGERLPFNEREIVKEIIKKNNEFSRN